MALCRLPALLLPASTLALSQRSSVEGALPSPDHQRQPAPSPPYETPASASPSYEARALLSRQRQQRAARSSARGRRLTSTLVSTVAELQTAVSGKSHAVINLAAGHYVLSESLHVDYTVVIEAVTHGSVVLDFGGESRTIKLRYGDISLIGLNITGANRHGVRRCRQHSHTKLHSAAPHPHCTCDL
ncbi:MAG: hypothetical protein SGPRY_001847 [Prymnesium sp.]